MLTTFFIYLWTTCFVCLSFADESCCDRRSLPPEDEVEPWVACDYCEDESTAWYHQRCVAYDKQIYGEAQWCCGQSECRVSGTHILYKLYISTPSNVP